MQAVRQLHPHKSSRTYLLHTTSGAPRCDRHQPAFNCRISGIPVFCAQRLGGKLGEDIQIGSQLIQPLQNTLALAAQTSIRELEGPPTTIPKPLKCIAISVERSTMAGCEPSLPRYGSLLFYRLRRYIRAITMSTIAQCDTYRQSRLHWHEPDKALSSYTGGAVVESIGSHCCSTVLNMLGWSSICGVASYTL
jgi:hypothetical protein